MRINPPKIFGSKVDEDPWHLIYKTQKVTQVKLMDITDVLSVDLASYQLKGDSHDWFM